jgi:hypothetical protein
MLLFLDIQNKKDCRFSETSLIYESKRRHTLEDWNLPLDLADVTWWRVQPKRCSPLMEIMSGSKKRIDCWHSKLQSKTYRQTEFQNLSNLPICTLRIPQINSHLYRSAHQKTFPLLAASLVLKIRKVSFTLACRLISLHKRKLSKISWQNEVMLM